MKKLVFSLCLICVAGAVSAQTNAAIKSYLGSTYMGGDLINCLSEVSQSIFVGPEGLEMAASISDYDFEAVVNRNFVAETSRASFSAGYARSFKEVTLGAALTASDSEFESLFPANPDERNTIEMDGLVLTLGASIERKGFVIGAQSSFGELSFDGVRENLFSQRFTTDFDADLFMFEVFVTYEFEISETLALIPYSKFSHATIEVDGFQEARAGAIQTLEMDSFDDDLSNFDFGVRGEWTVVAPLVIFADLSYIVDAGDDSVDQSGTNNSGISFERETDDAVGDIFEAEFGVGWDVTESIVLLTSASFVEGEEFDGYSAMLSLNWKF